MAAAHEALTDAGWTPTDKKDLERTVAPYDFDFILQGS
jgi:hypothetical protein